MYIDSHIQQQLNVTQAEFNLLYSIYIPLEISSIILCGFVCITYAVFQNKFPARLVLSMSLFVLLNNVADIWILFAGTRLFYDKTMCFAQGLLEQLAAIGGVVWWLCISVNMSCSFTLGVRTQPYEKYMHAACWVICIITLVFSIPHIGVAGLWCWINVPVWQFILFFGPMAFCLCIGGIFQFATIYKIYKINKLRVHKSEVVPFHIMRQVIFVCWYFGLFLFFGMHRVYIWYNNNVCPFYFVVPAVIAESSQGFFIFIIFGMRKKNWILWKEKIFMSGCNSQRGGSGYTPIT